VQRTSYAKTKQSFKVSGVEIWSDLPKNISENAMILSNKNFSKLLKKHFYNSNNVLM